MPGIFAAGCCCWQACSWPATPWSSQLVAWQGPQQQAAPRPTINLPTDPALRGFRWRSIGPVGQGARIDDFAVDEKNPSTFYIGYAVAGIWKTVNNGTTFENIFSTYGNSIADLALAPSDPNILYVATGEANNRQTTSYGDGLYKTTDAGKTFTKIGFEGSQTLGRIVVHPKDPNIAWIAVGGSLYGSNPERGVYMTTNGGTSWDLKLKVDENTGATEIMIDPSNPLNLWAAMYERRRTAWGFNGGGPGSGLYSTVDGGKNWKKMTGGGLPNGTMGRIALDVCRSQPNDDLRAKSKWRPTRKRPAKQHRRLRRRRRRRAVELVEPAEPERPERRQAREQAARRRAAPRRRRADVPAAAVAAADAVATPGRPIRRPAASSSRSTRARRGRSSCRWKRPAMPDVLQPDSRRSEQSGSRLQGRRQRAEDPPTAARPGSTSRTAARVTWTITPSGSIRSTATT